jgi:hypothetical protein
MSHRANHMGVHDIVDGILCISQMFAQLSRELAIRRRDTTD